MDLHRISVKYLVDEPAVVDLEAVIPVFHQWIQQSKVPGMLIDVADYRHMVDGPGVVLIGHDVDYAMDMTGGRPGLLHTRKRSFIGDLTAQLASVFQAALLACRALEQEERLGAKIRFRTDQLHLMVLDRLHAPNSDATFDQLRGQIQAFLDFLYEGASVSLQRDAEDQRRCFSLRIDAPGASGLDALLERLATPASCAGQ